MAQQHEQVTLQLNSDQMENLRGIFKHYGWDFNSAITETATSTCVLVDAETQTDNNDAENMADESENINEHFTIQQDPNKEECVYCFCRPCITNESNRQLWWEPNTHPPHQRNHSLRKEKYKRFWTMMYHRNVWIHPSYIKKKSNYKHGTAFLNCLKELCPRFKRVCGRIMYRLAVPYFSMVKPCFL
jgi:hypothetical protein